MRPKRVATWMAAAGLLVLFGGCVERRMTVRTNPPGALVYVNNVEMGVSPVSYAFVHYGASRVRLVRDGYETLTVTQDVKPPVYEILPIEPFAELLPWRFKDWREFTYDLEQTRAVDTKDLKDRGELARHDAQSAGQRPAGAPTAAEAVRLEQGEAVPALLAPDDPVWFQETGGK